MVLSFDRWRGQVAVVTGAGGGIGGAVVENLFREGLKVVGFDIRLDALTAVNLKLLSLANGKPGISGSFHPFQVDVRKEEEIVEAFKKVGETVGSVHILINCAGCGAPTNLVDGDAQLWRKVFDINVMAYCIATREAVRVMRDNGIDGHVILINSGAGHQVPNYPFMNVYPASKHAVTALTETLRQELVRLGSKIRITSVSPGPVETDIAFNSGFKPEKTLEKLVTSASKSLQKLLQPEDIADGIAYVLSTPPHVQVTGTRPIQWSSGAPTWKIVEELKVLERMGNDSRSKLDDWDRKLEVITTLLAD